MLKRIPRAVTLIVGVFVIISMVVWFMFTAPRRASVATERSIMENSQLAVDAAQAVIDGFTNNSAEFERDLEAVRMADRQTTFIEAVNPLAELSLTLPAMLVRSFESVGLPLDSMTPPIEHRSTGQTGGIKAVSVNIQVTGPVTDLRAAMSEMSSNGFLTTLLSASISTPRAGETCPVGIISPTGCVPISATLLVWYSTMRPVSAPVES